MSEELVLSLGGYKEDLESLNAHDQWKGGISVFFPMLNEEAYVEKAVMQMEKVIKKLTHDYEIILIDDGSTDNTSTVAGEISRGNSRVKVIRHDKNRGLGACLKTGFYSAGKELVFYSDIDLPFDFFELIRAVHLMEYCNADIISAYRLTRTSEGWLRIFYSFFYNVLIRFLFNIHVKDINFSFKLVRRRVIEDVQLKSNGSFIDAELIVKSIKKGYRVFQIGVDYFPRETGTSRLTNLKTISCIFKEMAFLYRETNFCNQGFRTS